MRSRTAGRSESFYHNRLCRPGIRLISIDRLHETRGKPADAGSDPDAADLEDTDALRFLSITKPGSSVSGETGIDDTAQLRRQRADDEFVDADETTPLPALDGESVEQAPSWWLKVRKHIGI